MKKLFIIGALALSMSLTVQPILAQVATTSEATSTPEQATSSPAIIDTSTTTPTTTPPIFVPEPEQLQTTEETATTSSDLLLPLAVPGNSFTITASSSPSPAGVNQPVTVTTHVTNTGAAYNGAVIDTEIYANNGAGARVFQNYVENQNFGAGEAKSFTSQWTPTQTGTYQIRMGVFGQNWSPQFAWVDNGSIVVGTTSGTTTPPNGTTTPPTDESRCGRPGTNNFNVCYYQGQNRDVFKLNRTDNQINFNWGQGSPDPLVPNDNFSARWLGLFDFENAEYEFTVTTDDGIKLNVDNETILNKWFDQPETTYKVRKMMNAGQKGVVVEYYENWGDAVAKVSWQKVGGGTSTPTTTPPTQGDNNVILNQTWQDASSINQGQTNTFYVQVRSPNTNNTVLIDLELYNSNGQKVAQEFWDNIFVPKAGTGNFQDVYKLTSPSNLPAGNYYWSAGIFKPGWNGVLNWYHSAQAFTIGGSQPPQTGDVTLQNSTLGQAQGNACRTLTAQLKNNSTSAKNVLVDFELRNASGALVHQYFVDNYTIAGSATQNLTNVCNLTLPAGQYKYSVGIFNPGWAGLLHWYDSIQTFNF
jgi:hypothetical protein